MKLPKVNPVARVIPTGRTWNRAVEALGNQNAPPPPGVAASSQPELVWVKNASGADVGRFNVLGIEGPIVTPTDNADEFKQQVAITGIVPVASDHSGAFAVMAEPIGNGNIGRGWISGACPVQISIADESHGTADVADGDAAKLVSQNGTGTVTILWAEAGTGTKWALIRFGGVGSSLPAGSGQYKVLQLDALDQPVWDYVKAH